MGRLTQLGFVLVTLVGHGFAYPGERFNLPELVDQSDVIALATVSGIHQLGKTSIVVSGQPVGAIENDARVQIEWLFKGNCPDELSLRFLVPNVFIGFRGVAIGRQIIFLKRRNDIYEFADAHYPSVPAAPGTPNVRYPDAVQALADELGRVLSSQTSPLNDKWTVLAFAYGIPNSNTFNSHLHELLLNTTDVEVRIRIEAELVARGDTSGLEQASRLLLGGTLTNDQKEILLLAIRNHALSPEAVPTLAPLMSSPDVSVRRAVAEGLWHSASVSGVSLFSKMLEDSDNEVRFYAVRGLSEIANDPGWGGPSESEFHEHEGKYVSHWQEWLNGHITKQKLE